jgi:hypothetical protein
MAITQEQRANILGENRAHGWAAVPDHAPEFVKAFVTEHRTAILEKRSMNPTFVASYKAGAEKRSLTTVGRLAVEFGKRLFRPSAISTEETLEQKAARQADEIAFERGEKLPTLTVARAISRRTGKSFEDVLFEGRSKTFHRQHGLDEATGPMTADEKESFRRAFERSLGLRPKGV